MCALCGAPRPCLAVSDEHGNLSVSQERWMWEPWSISNRQYPHLAGTGILEYLCPNVVREPCSVFIKQMWQPSKSYAKQCMCGNPSVVSQRPSERTLSESSEFLLVLLPFNIMRSSSEWRQEEVVTIVLSDVGFSANANLGLLLNFPALLH